MSLPVLQNCRISSIKPQVLERSRGSLAYLGILTSNRPGHAAWRSNILIWCSISHWSVMDTGKLWKWQPLRCPFDITPWFQYLQQSISFQLYAGLPHSLLSRDLSHLILSFFPNLLSCLFSQLKHSLLWDCCTWLSYMRGTSSAVHLCSSPFTKWLAIWAPRCALGSVRRMGKSQYLISNLPQPNVFRNLFHENPIWLYSSDNRFSRNGYGTVQTWDVTKYTKVATCCTIPISIQRVWGKYSQNALDKKCQRYVCLFKIESENSHKIPSNEFK